MISWSPSVCFRRIILKHRKILMQYWTSSADRSEDSSRRSCTRVPGNCHKSSGAKSLHWDHQLNHQPIREPIFAEPVIPEPPTMALPSTYPYWTPCKHWALLHSPNTGLILSYIRLFYDWWQSTHKPTIGCCNKDYTATHSMSAGTFTKKILSSSIRERVQSWYFAVTLSLPSQ